jgi:hypothetical protein
MQNKRIEEMKIMEETPRKRKRIEGINEQKNRQ